MIVTIYSNDASIDWAATGTERIIQNVKNIVRTRIHEVPFNRYMGLDPDYIDADSRAVQVLLPEHIKEIIALYEPRATVIGVNVDGVDENGDYIIAITLEV